MILFFNFVQSHKKIHIYIYKQLCENIYIYENTFHLYHWIVDKKTKNKNQTNTN